MCGYWERILLSPVGVELIARRGGVIGRSGKDTDGEREDSV
jgi:hypothetical protein